MFYEHVLFEYHKLVYCFPTKSLYTNVRISKRFNMAKPLSLAKVHECILERELVMDILYLVHFDPTSSRDLISPYKITM